MPEVNKTTLKTYFNTGDLVTESNMVDLIDSTISYITLGNADPTASGVSADVGTIGIDTNSTFWIKYDSANTAWFRIVTRQWDELLVARALVPVANGAQLDTVSNGVHLFDALKFDPSTDETATWSLKIPNYTRGNKVSIRITSRASATGDVVVSLSFLPVASGQNPATSFSTTTASTFSISSIDNYQINTITYTGGAGLFESGDFLNFAVTRDADNVSDTLAVDWEIHAIEILW